MADNAGRNIWELLSGVQSDKRTEEIEESTSVVESEGDNEEISKEINNNPDYMTTRDPQLEDHPGQVYEDADKGATADGPKDKVSGRKKKSTAMVLPALTSLRTKFKLTNGMSTKEQTINQVSGPPARKNINTMMRHGVGEMAAFSRGKSPPNLFDRVTRDYKFPISPSPRPNVEPSNATSKVIEFSSPLDLSRVTKTFQAFREHEKSVCEDSKMGNANKDTFETPLDLTVRKRNSKPGECRRDSEIAGVPAKKKCQVAPQTMKSSGSGNRAKVVQQDSNNRFNPIDLPPQQDPRAHNVSTPWYHSGHRVSPVTVSSRGSPLLCSRPGISNHTETIRHNTTMDSYCQTTPVVASTHLSRKDTLHPHGVVHMRGKQFKVSPVRPQIQGKPVLIPPPMIPRTIDHGSEPKSSQKSVKLPTRVLEESDLFVKVPPAKPSAVVPPSTSSREPTVLTNTSGNLTASFADTPVSGSSSSDRSRNSLGPSQAGISKMSFSTRSDSNMTDVNLKLTAQSSHSKSHGSYSNQSESQHVHSTHNTISGNNTTFPNYVLASSSYKDTESSNDNNPLFIDIPDHPGPAPHQSKVPGNSSRAHMRLPVQTPYLHDTNTKSSAKKGSPKSAKCVSKKQRESQSPPQLFIAKNGQHTSPLPSPQMPVLSPRPESSPENGNSDKSSCSPPSLLKAARASTPKSSTPPCSKKKIREPGNFLSVPSISDETSRSNEEDQLSRSLSQDLLVSLKAKANEVRNMIDEARTVKPTLMVARKSTSGVRIAMKSTSGKLGLARINSGNKISNKNTCTRRRKSGELDKSVIVSSGRRPHKPNPRYINEDFDNDYDLPKSPPGQNKKYSLEETTQKKQYNTDGDEGKPLPDSEDHASLEPSSQYASVASLSAFMPTKTADLSPVAISVDVNTSPRALPLSRSSSPRGHHRISPYAKQGSEQCLELMKSQSISQDNQRTTHLDEQMTGGMLPQKTECKVQTSRKGKHKKAKFSSGIDWREELQDFKKHSLRMPDKLIYVPKAEPLGLKDTTKNSSKHMPSSNQNLEVPSSQKQYEDKECVSVISKTCIKRKNKNKCEAVSSDHPVDTKQFSIEFAKTFGRKSKDESVTNLPENTTVSINLDAESERKKHLERKLLEIDKVCNTILNAPMQQTINTDPCGDNVDTVLNKSFGTKSVNPSLYKPLVDSKKDKLSPLIQRLEKAVFTPVQLPSVQLPALTDKNSVPSATVSSSDPSTLSKDNSSCSISDKDEEPVQNVSPKINVSVGVQVKPQSVQPHALSQNKDITSTSKTNASISPGKQDKCDGNSPAKPKEDPSAKPKKRRASKKLKMEAVLKMNMLSVTDKESPRVSDTRGKQIEEKAVSTSPLNKDLKEEKDKFEIENCPKINSVRLSPCKSKVDKKANSEVVERKNPRTPPKLSKKKGSPKDQCGEKDKEKPCKSFTKVSKKITFSEATEIKAASPMKLKQRDRKDRDNSNKSIKKQPRAILSKKLCASGKKLRESSPRKSKYSLPTRKVKNGKGRRNQKSLDLEMHHNRKRRSILDELANSDGYVAEKRFKTSDNLYADPSELSREERALQRAIMYITEMEMKSNNSTCNAPSRQPPPTTNTKEKAKKLMKNALKRSRATRPSVGKKPFKDFEPQIMSSRTRQQATAMTSEKIVTASQRTSTIEKEIQESVTKLACESENESPTLVDDKVKTAHKKGGKTAAKSKKGGAQREPDKETVIFRSPSQVSEPHASPSGSTPEGKMKWQSGVVLKAWEAQKSSQSVFTPKKGKRCRVRRKSGSPGKAQGYKISLAWQDDYEEECELPDLGLDDDEIAVSLEPEVSTEAVPFIPPTEIDCMSTSGRSETDSLRHIPPEVKKVSKNMNTGETVLHRAARLGYEEVSLWVAENHYCDLNAKDYAGFAPLHETCVMGHVTIAKTLLAHGADVNVSSTNGIRPIHDAVENEHFELIRMFLSCGADPTLTSYTGRTLISMAKSREMKTFLKGYMYDLNGTVGPGDKEDDFTWELPPSYESREFRLKHKSLSKEKEDVEESEEESEDEEEGFDILADAPSDSENSDIELDFDFSDLPHLQNYYVTVEKKKGPANYLILDDVLQRLCLDRDQFFQKYPAITSCPIKTTVLRKLSALHEIPVAPNIVHADTGRNGTIEVVELGPELNEILGVTSEKVRVDVLELQESDIPVHPVAVNTNSCDIMPIEDDLPTIVHKSPRKRANAKKTSPKNNSRVQKEQTATSTVSKTSGRSPAVPKASLQEGHSVKCHSPANSSKSAVVTHIHGHSSPQLASQGIPVAKSCVSLPTSSQGGTALSYSSQMAEIVRQPLQTPDTSMPPPSYHSPIKYSPVSCSATNYMVQSQAPVYSSPTYMPPQPSAHGVDASNLFSLPPSPMRFPGTDITVSQSLPSNAFSSMMPGHEVSPRYSTESVGRMSSPAYASPLARNPAYAGDSLKDQLQSTCHAMTSPMPLPVHQTNPEADSIKARLEGRFTPVLSVQSSFSSPMYASLQEALSSPPRCSFLNYSPDLNPIACSNYPTYGPVNGGMLPTGQLGTNFPPPVTYGTFPGGHMPPNVDSFPQQTLQRTTDCGGVTLAPTTPQDCHGYLALPPAGFNGNFSGNSMSLASHAPYPATDSSPCHLKIDQVLSHGDAISAFGQDVLSSPPKAIYGRLDTLP